MLLHQQLRLCFRHSQRRPAHAVETIIELRFPFAIALLSPASGLLQMAVAAKHCIARHEYAARGRQQHVRRQCMLLERAPVRSQDEHPPPGSPTRPPSASALLRLMDGAGLPGGNAVHSEHLQRTGLDAMAEELPVGQVASEPIVL